MMKSLNQFVKNAIGFALLSTLFALPLLLASTPTKGKDEVNTPSLCEPYPECVIYKIPDESINL
ncbi:MULTISPECIES: hypothetical protein [Shewanella]|jgi:hypothetical protein|uniref:Uncharacterized protein n=2 Tax=Shewanella TaxID=22 RepID=A0A6G7LVX4_9GAMM|nr:MULTISPECIES: hypothetical protein [Shewanella]MBZ4679841.1 hypothetical protein [Shewanella sp.]MCA0948972.1 hypothetical protein [Shewanella chilikensis]MCE9788413.1 hypothetical protein [Shewanella chilikensis]MCE9791047.1 hypothetical protein [Shewanella indica]MCE9851509.1 hypothetical protein [Shewanella chilikensis]